MKQGSYRLIWSINLRSLYELKKGGLKIVLCSQSTRVWCQPVENNVSRASCRGRWRKEIMASLDDLALLPLGTSCSTCLSVTDTSEWEQPTWRSSHPYVQVSFPIQITLWDECDVSAQLKCTGKIPDNISIIISLGTLENWGLLQKGPVQAISILPCYPKLEQRGLGYARLSSDSNSGTYPLLISCHCKGYMKSAEGVAQQLFKTTLNLETKQNGITLSRKFLCLEIPDDKRVSWLVFFSAFKNVSIEGTHLPNT